MIYNKVTAKTLTPFLDELQELMKKHNFATMTGIIISDNTGSSFKILASNVLIGGDYQRINAADKMVDQVAVSLTGSRIIT